jgi:glutaredoxin
MKTTKVPSKNKKHKILLYALSTCAWCKKVKAFFKENGIEYEYIDVDLADDETRNKIKTDISSRGGMLAFPTTIVDDKKLICGFLKDELSEALEI